MFYFKSYMAPTVDLATAEGEAGAFIECAKDAKFYRNLAHMQSYNNRLEC